MFYLSLFKALKAHDIDYLLIGGLAINLHVPRVTMDVDLVIELDSRNVNKLISSVNELGLRSSVPVKLEDLGDKAKCEKLFL